MTSTPSDLVAVFEAWKRANDQHRGMMEAVMAGGMLDAEAMEMKLVEIEVLHEEWMKLASEYAPVRAPDGPTTD